MCCNARTNIMKDIFARLSKELPIETEFKWDVPDECPIRIPHTEQGSFERNVFLKENLAPELENDCNYKCHFWVIQKWGGIASFKNNKKNQGRIDLFDQQLGKRKMTRDIFGGISSLSNISAFKKPDTYSIYDSRVIFALNWLLFCNTDEPILFPQPTGRNAELKDIDANTLMKLSGKKFAFHSYETAYFEYCEFNRELAKQVLGKDKPYYAEMLLFAAAPTWIVKDILRRTKVTICFNHYLKDRYDPIAKWFSEKQKLLGEKLILPKLPPVEISDEVPPALREKRKGKKRKGDEQPPAGDITFDVETLLGCYNPEEKQITIWRKGIEFCCARICPDGYDKLFELVLVHELGHWFHNEAETEGGEWDQSRVPNADQKKEYEEYTKYSEAWAQWFAWVYANEIGGGRRELFIDLEKKQSEPYKAWRVFCDCDLQEKDCMFDRSQQEPNLRCLSKLRQSNGDLTLKRLKNAICFVDVDPETEKTFGDFIEEL